jgi:pyridoxal phosphate enzyme (YggS family)
MTDPNQKPKTRTIAERHNLTLSGIAAAAKRAGRSPAELDLVAVSKQQPTARVRALLTRGHKIFGENRVQEAQVRWGETFAVERKDLTLHLIGPLQSNKAAAALALFDVIETVDRASLLKALVKAAEKSPRPLPRLYVQVNTGEEPQKSGVTPAKLPRFLKSMREDYGLTPEGLMCIPPANQAPSPHFWFLKNLARENGLEKLSMGMSGDYETAIEMGATSVRLGSALFGPRPQ